MDNENFCTKMKRNSPSFVTYLTSAQCVQTWRYSRYQCGNSTLPIHTPACHGTSNPVAKFFLWGFVKDNVYVPPLPANLQELHQQIRAAVAVVSRDMLERVWGELDYRIDICRISKCGHIEHL